LKKNKKGKKKVETPLSRFTSNIDGAVRLMQIHAILHGKVGRPFFTDELNRGAILLICASWEAFIEDTVRMLLRGIFGGEHRHF
jgi:hypothetical protein